MKYTLFVLLLLQVVFVSSNELLDAPKYNNSYVGFLNHLKRGYVWPNKSGKDAIPRWSKKLTVCFYHKKINSPTMSLLNDIDKLLTKELNIIYYPFYVKKLDDCPFVSDIFVFIHEGYKQKSIYVETWKELLHRYQLPETNELRRFRPNSLGFYTNRYRRPKRLGFVSINQMSLHISNESIMLPFLKSLILEELFQAISLGRDIKVDKISASILEEPTIDIGPLYELNVDSVKLYSEHFPSGLCGYDLWFLLLAYNSGETIYLYESYKERFKNNYEKIKKRSLEIENNPAYKGLFDPRCSGNNTGINTKIGVQKPR